MEAKAAKRSAGAEAFHRLASSRSGVATPLAGVSAPVAAPSTELRTTLSAPSSPPALVHPPAPIPLDVDDFQFAYGEDDSEEDEVLRFSPPPKRNFPTYTALPTYAALPAAARPREEGWGSLMRRMVAPQTRRLNYPNAVELSATKRCPWLDIFIHKDWVYVFVYPVPSNASVGIETDIDTCFIKLGNWIFPPGCPITMADTVRSSRPREFVFRLDLEGLGVDLGSACRGGGIPMETF